MNEDLKLLGWTLGQWSTVAKRYPFNIELLELRDFADAKFRWVSHSLDEPEECLNACPTIEMGIRNICDHLCVHTMAFDKNTRAMDAAHDKAIKPVDTPKFYGGMPGGGMRYP